MVTASELKKLTDDGKLAFEAGQYEVCSGHVRHRSGRVMRR